MRLILEIAADEDIDAGLQESFGVAAEDKIFGIPPPWERNKENQPTQVKKFIPRCMEAMKGVRSMLQCMADKANARNMLQQASLVRPLDNQETLDFSRLSLVEQHECLASILHAAVQRHHATVADFQDFIKILRKWDKYDHFLIHLIPVLAAYITEFGSPEGMGDLQQARRLNDFICKGGDEDSWALPVLGAAVRAWWIAEHNGFYLDDTVQDLRGINLDEEDEQRTKQFLDALKEGAFDFILSVAADCKAQEWQDPSQLGARQWLQRKIPSLPSEPFPFSHFLQHSLMVHLEGFIDATISNLPDVLRKLRTEEDEQRQLRPNHEQDMDLERFLIIISYAYEGRPDAAMSFWEDPDSNLAGFLQWASRRASTPLVSAFCEMLRCLADNEECATAAHNFLLDEGHQASGKMKRSQSLTWSQIFKELEYFTTKVCSERPNPPQASMHRPGRPGADPAEIEPESALMLECYLRLIAKLATESEIARKRLIMDEDFNLVDTILKLSVGVIPHRLRACIFYVLKALMIRKTHEELDAMWRWVEAWMTNPFSSLPGSQGAPQRISFLGQTPGPQECMEMMFREFGTGFEQSNAFIQLLTTLLVPPEGLNSLNDSVPFPEWLGSSIRTLGIEPYVDFVFDVFANRTKDISDPSQLRILRLSCLDFVMVCLVTFNEDLIVLGHESNISIDDAMAATNLATYVRLHPFSRVMEWLFNEKVITSLINTIHQDPISLGSASPDSPLVVSILRAIQVMIKALELQETYLHLVRPEVLRYQGEAGVRRKPVANAAYSAFEDGILSHLSLVVDLGKYCNLGHAELTLACLKLLEKISTSSRILSAWSPDSGRLGHRNKAIVQLERNGEGETISASLSASIMATLDPALAASGENYRVKLAILDFLYACLRATPDQPTIAHQLLGFHCELSKLGIEPKGPFDMQKSLFHSLLNVLITLTVSEEEQGMRGYLVTLKYRVLRILQLLWKSPLSASLVMDELRATNFLFHMLLREVQIQPQLPWDGQLVTGCEFLLSDASLAYIDYLASRAAIFEYIGKELCSVSQNRIPSIKRQIFDALNGQIFVDEEAPLTIPSIFDFFDFINTDYKWEEIPSPHFTYLKDLDLGPCILEHKYAGVHYDIRKAQEILALKRKEYEHSQLATPEFLETVELEEKVLIEWLTVRNRANLLLTARLNLLQAWANLLLVMIESNDFKSTPKMAFLLQALQAILPTLEAFSSLKSDEAFELARVAKVLLWKLDFSQDSDAGLDREQFTVGNLIGDKLFQLFQLCLSAISQCSGTPELRSLYYSICYRYLTAVVDNDATVAATPASSTIGPTRSVTNARARTLKAITLYGDRLLNVICDDAYGSDTTCQTAAMILLNALVHTSRASSAAGVSPADVDCPIIDALNRLNFIGVLVDSLKEILNEWLAPSSTFDPSLSTNASPSLPIPASPSQQYTSAKLALLLQLCQTRQGAKYVLQANLFRALEQSGVFAADPELVEVDSESGVPRVVALERHYALLVALARVVGAAVTARGAHNIVQGRKFLTQHRGLVVHVLKKNAGIGGGVVGNSLASSVNGGSTATMTRRDEILAQQALEERIEELAEAFMLLITATGFLEVCSAPVHHYVLSFFLSLEIRS